MPLGTMRLVAGLATFALMGLLFAGAFFGVVAEPAIVPLFFVIAVLSLAGQFAAVVVGVKPRVQAVIWSRDEVHVVVPGHQQSPKVLRRLIDDANRLAGRVAPS